VYEELASLGEPEEVSTHLSVRERSPFVAIGLRRSWRAKAWKGH
jgi:hypothetical protein